jgi:hypothetical protein
MEIDALTLAIQLAKTLDPDLTVLPPAAESYPPIEALDNVLCENVLQTFPNLGALLLVRDTVYQTKLTDLPPSIDQIVWQEFCRGAKDFTLAFLNIHFKAKYYAPEIVSSGFRNCNGQIGFAVRTGTPEEIENNKRMADMIEIAKKKWMKDRDIITH